MMKALCYLLKQRFAVIIKTILLLTVVSTTSAFAEVVGKLQLENTSIDVLHNGDTYQLSQVPAGAFDTPVYLKNGDILYITGNGNEVEIIPLGNWKNPKDTFSNPLEFIEARLQDLDKKGLDNLTDDEFYLYDGLQQAQIELKKAETARKKARNAELDELLAKEKAETARLDKILVEKKAETARMKAETARKKAETARLDKILVEKKAETARMKAKTRLKKENVKKITELTKILSNSN